MTVYRTVVINCPRHYRKIYKLMTIKKLVSSSNTSLIAIYMPSTY